MVTFCSKMYGQDLSSTVRRSSRILFGISDGAVDGPSCDSRRRQGDTVDTSLRSHDTFVSGNLNFFGLSYERYVEASKRDGTFVCKLGKWRECKNVAFAGMRLQIGRGEKVLF